MPMYLCPEIMIVSMFPYLLQTCVFVFMDQTFYKVPFISHQQAYTSFLVTPTITLG